MSKEDTGSIYYETFDLTENSNMNFKGNLLTHLGCSGVAKNQFEPVHVVLITWDETEFTVRGNLLSKFNYVTISL